MEMISEFVDAKKLMSVISLPDTMKNRRLEVIVFPAEETSKSVQRTEQIESIVDRLTGIIPDNGMSLEDYRAERLSKYEVTD